MIKLVFATLVKPPYVRIRGAVQTAMFDRRYGVETEGLVSTADAGVTDPHSMHYLPAGVLSLRRILPPSSVGPDDVFVDFGSGKGRIVLQAALHYPFRAVYGVELSESLHTVAERNVATLRDRFRCPEVHLLQGDARTVDLPDDVTVVYLYNPFRGAVFADVVDRLIASVDRNPRRMRIVYGNPEEEAALLATGRVRLLRATRGWRPSREWSRSNSFRLYEVTPRS
ncbi:methyltransferase domain-containing protein [Blastococcus sp. PRF04-17]|uniref:methyltransferase domain-containing protein n=1 Tax=Blastococcus sp. PRF04-17 TaxID=2933797 RepID=UPI001FF44012|nr:methyltransferase domain-containing protein [Blastococcus sp. PRF04-17]UOY00200.1 methyltransferase domain-containing protein [Blastococcus sp. PRF04-17]